MKTFINGALFQILFEMVILQFLICMAKKSEMLEMLEQTLKLLQLRPFVFALYAMNEKL